MSSGNSEFSKPRDRGRGRAFGVYLNNCLTFMVKQIRQPLMAYLVVFTIISLAFGFFQIHVNERLQRQDYKACMSRNDVLQQANLRNARLVTKDGKPITPYKLTNCEPLRP